ncbi:zinc-binding dehydrogenase [Hoeflea prorocentri]|uniref:Zinc-binding dehydrogenase n=1 Tax=Hoeflea prorocentri TaxID=1922333 RepID=A0A9X3ZII6_9HYPH|nr:zinc-binding dehydrogenase [Hoeflea prorocentri]MCY6381765.1 zinc-binding dehydrogenase [Hoeflea prorocentri]MDA5399565.1 zinc-binding dehydrogenase [Hoeflea prorocentri]
MKDMMTAAVYHALDDIRIEQWPVPKVGAGEVLVKTLACGLCGGETMAWYKKAEPKVLGHEPVGEIVEIGAGVTDFSVGDRIFVNHHVGRINSHLSRRGHFTRDPFYSSMRIDPGGVCEYFRALPQHLAMDTHKLPESISNEAAVTIEPWSCVLSGLKVCHIQPGDTIAVVGAGFMGQGFVHLAPFFGAGKVIALDFSDWRLQKAREFGATHTINPKSEDAVEALREANNGRLADTVIVIAPFPEAWDQALKLVEVGGCLHLGAPLAPGVDWVRDGNAAYFDQITVTSRYSSDHTDTYSYIRLLESGRIDADKAVTHRFDIADSAEAFRMLVEAEQSLKIAVYPHGIPEGSAG